MAKRKRLTAPTLDQTTQAAPKGNAMLSDAPLGTVPKRRAPIADVAGNASANAALERVATELTQAKSEGRMIQKIALTTIDATHLIRDRVTLDAGEMESLKTSIAARGQQTPIEVVETSPGEYGLISGYRRLMALRALSREAEAPIPALALVRTPQDASDAYTAMVEENEVRVGLSYFERANIVRRAVDAGVFPSEAQALKDLFASASRTKRSKIKSFLPVVTELGGVLQFPASLTERQGLGLATKLSEDPGFGERLRDRLRKAEVQTATDEATLLQRALSPKESTSLDLPSDVTAKPGSPATSRAHIETLPSGIKLFYRRGELRLSGNALDLETISRVVQMVRGVQS